MILFSIKKNRTEAWAQAKTWVMIRAWVRTRAWAWAGVTFGVKARSYAKVK
jgi:hypothetical protein